MIVRLWSARAGEVQSRAYVGHFRRAVLSKLRGAEGYVGSTVLTRSRDGHTEILVATVWASLEAILQFAGPDLERAVVDEEAAALLAEFDGRVRHFETAATDLFKRDVW